MNRLASILEPFRTGFLMEKLRRSRAAVASWKRGTSLPEPSLLPELAGVLNIDRAVLDAAYAQDAAER